MFDFIKGNSKVMRLVLLLCNEGHWTIFIHILHDANVSTPLPLACSMDLYVCVYANSCTHLIIWHILTSMHSIIDLWLHTLPYLQPSSKLCPFPKLSCTVSKVSFSISCVMQAFCIIVPCYGMFSCDLHNPVDIIYLLQ